MTDKHKRPSPLLCVILACVMFSFSFIVADNLKTQISFSTISILLLIIGGVADILNTIDKKF